MKMTVTKVGGKEPGGKPQAIGRWTFSTSCVRRVVEDHLEGYVLNACAGKTKLRHGAGEIVRNDINPEIDADYHIDVCKIDNHLDGREFDTIVFDPPYDQSQADEHYDGMHASDLNEARQALARLTAPGGKLIEFGWSSHGADAYSGWKRQELRLFQRGPCLQDVIMTVDRNHQTKLTLE